MDDDLGALLQLQHDVLHRDQALQYFDATLARRNLTIRWWQAPHRSVLVLHNGPLTQPQRLWTASLAAPAGSALWGASAAGFDGYRDRFADEDVHVALPVGARRVPVLGS